jgi:hypothetical protein
VRYGPDSVIFQALYSDGTVHYEFVIGRPLTTAQVELRADREATDPTFECDCVRAITIDGELIYETEKKQ